MIDKAARSGGLLQALRHRPSTATEHWGFRGALEGLQIWSKVGALEPGLEREQDWRRSGGGGT